QNRAGAMAVHHFSLVSYSPAPGCSRGFRMRAIRLFLSIGSWALIQAQMPPAADRKIDYTRDVQPLLAQKCYSCHGEDVQQSGLRLDKRQNALRGGDYGPVIKLGSGAESKLVRRLVN